MRIINIYDLLRNALAVIIFSNCVYGLALTDGQVGQPYMSELFNDSTSWHQKQGDRIKDYQDFDCDNMNWEDKNDRIKLYKDKILRDWAEGDIMLLGDSFTDRSRALYDPLFPRLENFAINGAKISDATQLINEIINETDTVQKLSANPPSKVVVLIGGNDLLVENQIAFDQDTKNDYTSLFTALYTFALQVNPNLEVVFVSIPYASFDHKQPSYPQRIQDWLLTMNTINLANNWLDTRCTYYANNNFNVSFLDIRDVFLHPVLNTPSLSYFFAVGDPHPGQLGYERLLSVLAPHVYPQLSNMSGSFASLPEQPSSCPSHLADEDELSLVYRYATVSIPGREELTISIQSGSPDKYVAIFDPARPSLDDNLPVAENAGSNPSCSVVNRYDFPTNVIVCYGINPNYGGNYVATISSQNQDRYEYSVPDDNWASSDKINFMPDIASDISGNLVATWYEANRPGVMGQALKLRSSVLQNNNVSWDEPETIYPKQGCNFGNIKSVWEYEDPNNPVGNNIPWGAQLVYDGSGFSLTFPTVNGNLLTRKSASGWSCPEWMPVIGTTSPNTDYNPKLFYRPADNVIIGNWATWGKLTSSPSSYMDLAIVSKTPTSSAWGNETHLEAASGVSRAGHIKAFSTGVRLDDNFTIYAFTEQVGNNMRLLAGPFKEITITPNRIFNPQIAWSKTNSKWILTWSEEQVDHSVDLFYAVGSADASSWSEDPLRVLPLPDYDKNYDFASDLAFSADGVRLIWERSYLRKNYSSNLGTKESIGISDYFVSDYDAIHDSWTYPRKLNSPEPRFITGGRLTATPDHWAHIVEWGTRGSSFAIKKNGSGHWVLDGTHVETEVDPIVIE